MGGQQQGNQQAESQASGRAASKKPAHDASQRRLYIVLRALHVPVGSVAESRQRILSKRHDEAKKSGTRDIYGNTHRSSGADRSGKPRTTDTQTMAYTDEPASMAAKNHGVMHSINGPGGRSILKDVQPLR